jgi:DNA sulfur modification protein DndD
MYLTHMQLRNWRSYRNATFSLAEPERGGRRNVILVGAQNGVGKTSFLIALYLGLFGREAMPLIEGFSDSVGNDTVTSYGRLIEGILHRPAQALPDPYCLVSLRFVVDEVPIVVTRKWNFRTGGKVRDLNGAEGEEIFIEQGGRKRALASWQEANNRVTDLLFPSNVMSCLFFDGEQAQARVEAAGGRALFDAVKTLYGTGLLEQLADSLRVYVNNQRAMLKSEHGEVDVGDLDRKRQELDVKRDQLLALQKQLKEARERRDASERRRKAAEKELYDLVGDNVSDVQEYSNEVLALQNEETALRQSLIAQIAGVAFPLAVSRSGHRIRAALDADAILERWLVLRDEASVKADQIVEDVLPPEGPSGIDPPLQESQLSSLRQRLEKALELLWSPPPAGCPEEARFPFLSSADRGAVSSLISRAQGGAAAELERTARSLDAVCVRLAETRERFTRTRDVEPALRRLKAEVQAALDEQSALNGEVSSLERKELADQQAIADLRAAIGQMESRERSANPIQAQIEVAQRLRELADDAKDRLVPLCKKALEESCTRHFRGMISTEYRDFRARFESQSEPWLEGPNGRQVLVSTMSGAQKRAFGLAFTLAVAEVAGAAAPIVIDTPVGNMDSQYRSRVLKYVASAAPGQVIFLSHDEEIYGPYVDALKPQIVQRVLVEFEEVGDGSGVSTVNEGKYFE